MLAALLDGCNGVCWSVVYTASIVLGIRWKTYLIPAISTCLNFSWEFWAVFDRIIHGTAQGQSFFIQAAWLVLDVGVFATLLLYGPRKSTHVCWQALIGLAAALAGGYVLLIRMGLFLSCAFWDNALMSWLFIWYAKRENGGEKSLLIAAAKLLGTLSATVLEGIIYRNLLVLWLGGVCLILDIFYLMICIRGEKEGEPG